MFNVINLIKGIVKCIVKCIVIGVIIIGIYKIIDFGDVAYIDSNNQIVQIGNKKLDTPLALYEIDTSVYVIKSVEELK